MVEKVGLLTYSVKAPPAVIVLPLNADVAALVPPVIVTAPPVLMMFPVRDAPKFMSYASVRAVDAATVIEPEVEVTEPCLKMIPSRFAEVDEDVPLIEIAPVPDLIEASAHPSWRVPLKYSIPIITPACLCTAPVLSVLVKPVIVMFPEVVSNDESSVNITPAPQLVFAVEASVALFSPRIVTAPIPVVIAP